MAQNNPYDMSQWTQAFDPERIRQMWDPQNMMRAFQAPQRQMFDMEEVIRANQRNFDAMAEANKAAAEAYKSLIDKQMEIFNQMTERAREQYDWIEQNAGAGQMKAKTAAMNEAVEEALKMMRRIAEEARHANEEAYEMMQSRMNEAGSRVEETAKKAAAATKTDKS